MHKYVSAIFLIGLLLGAGPGQGAGGIGDPNLQAQAFMTLVQAIVRNEDRVEADELATWIVEGKEDFVLVDIRAESEFSVGHIKTARHIPIAELVTTETLKTLPEDRKVVLYSNGSEYAAKAVTMLRLAGIDAHLLLGGYNFWNKHILNPDLSQNADEEVLEVQKRHALSCYFRGDYNPEAGLPLPLVAETTSTTTEITPPEEPSAGQESAAEDTEDEEYFEEGELIVEEAC